MSPLISISFSCSYKKKNLTSHPKLKSDKVTSGLPPCSFGLVQDISFLITRDAREDI